MTPDANPSNHVVLKEDLSNWDEYEAGWLRVKPETKTEPERYGVEVFKMTWLAMNGWTRSGWHWEVKIDGKVVGYSGAMTRWGAWWRGWQHLRWHLKERANGRRP